ncbi:MAG: glycoside hydrolase family 88 protein [Lachnospiraceae bacterium]|nr:glycoside hydrolase family 88 protein [Lachnospiraceae bacterium]
MKYKEKMTEILDRELTQFDEKENMVTRVEKVNQGYHTKVEGKIHHIKATSVFAVGVLLAQENAHYDKAFSALERICDLQDIRKDSPTFGLWSYYMEEDLEHMIAPDYNWANFVGRDLLAVCILCEDKLPDALKSRLHEAIRNAAECTIRRNVAADYTNISLMGSLTIIAAGELLRDDRIFQIGKRRLEKLCEYTRVTTGFSEYNSSAYVMIAIEEISRMLVFFKEEECRAMAQELNRYAWEMLASHYNTSLAQLTPPQTRAYMDVDDGRLANLIWLGTEGRYGSSHPEHIGLDAALYLKFHCPEEVLPLFEEKERFFAHTYYRKNDIRQPGEDVTIIRELDSPDLIAYSYKTSAYSMGAFALCDTWNQRRNVMVVWDKEKPKTFRLRGIHNGYDFCSGMAYAVQDKNHILGHLGFVTDRGSFHYILDKVKNGVYDVEELNFRFELGGNSADVIVREVKNPRHGKDFVVEDAFLRISLHIEKWVFDGKDASVYLSEDGRAVILEGYKGPAVQLDTNRLGDTYGVFVLSVDTIGLAREAGELQTKEETKNMDEIQINNLPGGKVKSEWKGMSVTSPGAPVPYRRALGLDTPTYDKMQSQIQTILKKMQGMEADGTVEETCPISIISMDAWEWPQGVALFAMYQYYRESGDKSVLEYLKAWFDRQIAKGLPPQNINTTCPMLTLACIYEEERNEKYLPLLQEWLEGVMHRLPRTPEGGLQHIVSGILNEGQLWDDTLYMTVLFLARMGHVLGKEDYIQESIRQFMVHIKYLSDVKTGLFFHGWTFCGNHHFAEALWGRGNSWYTAGLVDYLECLEGNEGVKQFLLTTLLRQAEALENCQDESGLWHTILDDADSYLETSASCAFAYGILKAVRKGYLPARFAMVGEKAVKGVMEQIAEDGTVNGVSYGTPVFSTIQEYKEIPICPMPYGQSMALMMLVEAYRGKN